MSDDKVPEKMRGIYDEIIALTDAVCVKHLSQEYADLSRKMAAALSRKRPSPLASGRAKTWAAGIVYALGQINFLFDKSQTPHVPARELCALFEVNQNSASGKAKQIRDTLKIHLFDHHWLLPSQLAAQPDYLVGFGQWSHCRYSPDAAPDPGRSLSQRHHPLYP